MKIQKEKIIILFIVLLIVSLIIFVYGKFILNNLLNFIISNNLQNGNFTKVEFLLKREMTFNNLFHKQKTMNKLIRFYNDQRSYNKSEVLYLKKINSDKILPDNDIFNYEKDLDVVDAFYSLAYLYLNKNEPQKANQYVFKALTIISKLEKKDKLIIGKKLSKGYEILALSSLIQNDAKNTETYFSKSIAILKDYGVEKKKGSSAFFSIYSHLFDYHLRKNDIEKAKLYAQKMYTSIPQSELPVTSETVFQARYLGIVNEKMGLLYTKQKKYSDAERLLRNAYNINFEIYGKFSPEVLCDNFYLSNLYKVMGNEHMYKESTNKILFISKRYNVLKDLNLENLNYKMEGFCKVFN